MRSGNTESPKRILYFRSSFHFPFSLNKCNYPFDTDRPVAVRIHTHVIPSKSRLCLLKVIRRSIMLMTVQMNSSSIIIRPFFYRVMEQHKFLIVLGQFVIVLHPAEHPGILQPCFVIHEPVVVAANQVFYAFQL